MTDPAAYLPVLQSGRWFAHLPPGFAQPLIAMAQVRHLQPGEVLFLRGDAPCGLYAVVRGAISISGTGGRAHEARAALLTRLEPPHWFGEISVFDNSARTHDAHAAEPSTLLQVPHERLLAWLQARRGQGQHGIEALAAHRIDRRVHRLVSFVRRGSAGSGPVPGGPAAYPCRAPAGTLRSPSEGDESP